MKDKLTTTMGNKFVRIFMALMLAVMLVPVAAITQAQKAFAWVEQPNSITVSFNCDYDQGYIDDCTDSSHYNDFETGQLRIHIDNNNALHLYREFYIKKASKDDSGDVDNKLIEKDIPDPLPYIEELPKAEIIDEGTDDAENASKSDDTQTDTKNTKDESDEVSSDKASETMETDTVESNAAESNNAVQQAFADDDETTTGTCVYQAYGYSGYIFSNWKLTVDGAEVSLKDYTGNDKYLTLNVANGSHAVVITPEFKTGKVLTGKINWDPEAGQWPSVFFVDGDNVTHEAEVYEDDEGNFWYTITLDEDQDGIFYLVSQGYTTQSLAYTAGSEECPTFTPVALSEDQIGKITGNVYFQDTSGSSSEPWLGSYYYVFAYEKDNPTNLLYATYVWDGEWGFDLSVQKNSDYDLWIYAPGYSEAIVSSVSVPSTAGEGETYPTKKIDDVTLTLNTSDYVMLNFDKDSLAENVELSVLQDSNEVNLEDCSYKVAVPYNSHYSLNWQTGQLVISANKTSSTSNANQAELNAVASSLSNNKTNSDVLDSFNIMSISLTPDAGYTFYEWDASTLLATLPLADEGYFTQQTSIGLKMWQCGYLTVKDTDNVVDNYTYVLASTDLQSAESEETVARKTDFSKVEDFEMMTPSTLSIKNGKLISKFTNSKNDGDDYYYNFSIKANLKGDGTVEKWIVNDQVMEEGQSLQVNQGDKIVAQPVLAGSDTPSTDTTAATTSSSAQTGDTAWVWFAVIASLAAAGFGTYEISRRRKNN